MKFSNMQGYIDKWKWKDWQIKKNKKKSSSLELQALEKTATDQILKFFISQNIYADVYSSYFSVIP